ncbi:RNA ligase family protein [Paenibacillus elgii]|uniref:ATP-dependent DNA ligase n=1 Tax=Paenibacillus elgii TaxID=189691 RepID=UPI002D7D4048|nr:RNA ligase family protein [Paenibacillus elgii]
MIKPMLLQYAKNNLPFDDPNCITELKLDGIRLIVSNMESLRLYTKNTDATDKYPELHDAPLEKGTVLDGELIVTDEEGKPDFEACNARFKSKKLKHQVTFCAFDILMYRGIDVTGLPLHRRKELLEESFEETPYYTRVRPVTGSATQYFDIVKQYGLEGIVIKKKQSKYEVGTRSWSWVKVINWKESEVFITGYNKKDFSWLIGVQEGNKIRPMGTMEHGITKEARILAWPVLRQSKVGENDQYVFVEPLLKCKVKFRDYYKSGLMRIPVFQGFIT